MTSKQTYTIPFLIELKHQVLFLVVVGVILYSNTLFHQFALDDDIIINKNEYVQEGFKGIPKILTRDAYDSFLNLQNSQAELSGGRYRPLSIVCFAVEHQLFPNNWLVHHFLNIVFYIFSIVVLFKFLRNYIFKEQPLVAFLATLFFLIHPIHTEVVANVKSRDEIFSFLFIILTLDYFFQHIIAPKNTTLAKSLICFFLALLSKEYATMMLILIPLSAFLFYGKNILQSLKYLLPFLVVFIIYFIIRIKAVGLQSVESKELLNNPYLFATPAQKIATEIFVLGKYFLLLLFPHPLSSDYSYNQIPYKNFSEASVWLVIIGYLAVIIAGIYFTIKKNKLAFVIALYLLPLFLISNFVVDIGATMGERLVYHSSLAIAIFLAIFIDKIFQKNRNTALALVSIIILFSSFKTISRNADWKTNQTLFLEDVKHSPNSVLINGNAAQALLDMAAVQNNFEIKKQLADSALSYLDKAVALHPNYLQGYLNYGVAYFHLREPIRMEYYWDIARKLSPQNPVFVQYDKSLAFAFYSQAMQFGESGKIDGAISCLKKSVQYQPKTADYWYHLGGALFTAKKFDEAKQAWNNCLQLNPNYELAKQGLATIAAQEGK